MEYARVMEYSFCYRQVEGGANVRFLLP